MESPPLSSRTEANRQAAGTEMTAPGVSGGLVDAFGGRYVRIQNSDRMEPFFMNVVSSSDLWLFLASNGGLTAGRESAEHALFPYQTVDKIIDSAGITGPSTLLFVETGQGEVLWQPFAERSGADSPVIRSVYKSIEGDRVWFEEVHPGLGAAFRYGWSSSESHGLVRRCELENLGKLELHVRLQDGLRNILPSGIQPEIQSHSSCLADAYKTAEVLPSTTMAVYSLAAAIVDRAMPLESLRSSAVWAEGLPEACLCLSDRHVARFRSGHPVEPEERCRGVRTSYLLSATLRLPAHGRRQWMMVADVELSQPEISHRRRALLSGGLSKEVLASVDASTRALRGFVAAADGLQAGGKEATCAHHFANVVFNIMRGGVFQDGHRVTRADFASFLHTRNRRVEERFRALVACLPPTMELGDFKGRIGASGDPDLERLGLEYLPLTFSRRHGDPSRPWNRFTIRLRDDKGNRILSHEGNWRDIFQNWEALCLSHPEFLESMVAKFLNASTQDGYNPYRISQAGIDWEVPEPGNPWASIGYWGDHQVIYLEKLLEWSCRFHPGRLREWLKRPLFAYANVPYRICSYEEMRKDPRSTITFDAALSRSIEEQVKTQGTDARLVVGNDGQVLRANLTEKLLILVLTRLSNMVPGGGIWMNTQRPEWNDANNALVGNGASVVTLCYLRRMLSLLKREIAPALSGGTAPVAGAVAELLRETRAALAAHRDLPGGMGEQGRRSFIDAVAKAGAAYRARAYAGLRGEPVEVSGSEVQGLLDEALNLVDDSLRANRRADGLYHAYNLLEFEDRPPRILVRHLGPMLEGQVAILSSGLLSAAEAADLLGSLRQSALYRADQDSYLLYPDREQRAFMERNVIARATAEACPLFGELLKAGDRSLVVRDAEGQYRFPAGLTHAAALESALCDLAAEPRWAAQVASGAEAVRTAFEEVFSHRTFTGRSGSMFGYEGLGCIYWHMVAKLLLAIQENLFAAEAVGDPAATRLATFYREVRAGLGFNKPPHVYGAFPTDPYSHTPGHSGAQQPGMTGQVKEEILTRMGELGVRIEAGSVSFRPTLLSKGEFLAGPSNPAWSTPDGRPYVLHLPEASLAFSLAATPVVYRLSPGEPFILVRSADGVESKVPGTQLDPALSSRLFSRRGSIERLEVHLGAAYQPLDEDGSPARHA